MNCTKSVRSTTPPSAMSLAALHDASSSNDPATRAAAQARVTEIIAQCPKKQEVAYAKVKVAKYSPAVADATQQVRNGTRAMAPVLVPCIFSHAGEMSPESLRVVELITRRRQFSSLASTLYFEDGIPLKRRTAAFRSRFKDALMVANANGFGSTVAHAGTPRAGKFLSPAEAYGGLPDWEVIY